MLGGEFDVLPAVGGGEEKADGDSRVSIELERDLDRFEIDEIWELVLMSVPLIVLEKLIWIVGFED